MNKARKPTSNKTGIVLKISLVLFLLLTVVVYKLNDYFKTEKLHSTQAQIRSKVVATKTTISSQLQQLKNTLSGYETDLSETNINWMQLDPFFAIAKVDSVSGALKVSQILVRTNTPAERWNADFMERALLVNKSKNKEPILIQLFQDKALAKYLIIRFQTTKNNELVVVGSADYFQKYFDIQRGELSTALLATTGNILVAHTEGDYISTTTAETNLTVKKYIFEKEEILGTNLVTVNYILKKKNISGFIMPWSIVGIIAGVGCILVALLFYGLDPIERKVERYKKQERDQIYKDTLGDMQSRASVNKLEVLQSVKTKEIKTEVPVAAQPMPNVAKPLTVLKAELPKNFYNINAEETKPNNEVVMTAPEKITPEEITVKTQLHDSGFISLGEGDEKMDLLDIEKVLALDDFDSDPEEITVASAVLEKTFTPQKINVSGQALTIDKPQFQLKTKNFSVDEFKVHIRTPEKS